MPELIGAPSRVAAAGEPPKLIDEYVGRASTGDTGLSVAHMRSPSGWAEPGQRPEFDEFTIVLRGAVVVEFDGGRVIVEAGQGVHARPGEWVRYSTPGDGGAEYVSVCLPAFAPGIVHRDGEPGGEPEPADDAREAAMMRNVLREQERHREGGVEPGLDDGDTDPEAGGV